MNKIMSRDCQLVNQTLSFDEDLGNTGECPSCRKNSLKIAKMPDIGIEVCFCVACDFKEWRVYVLRMRRQKNTAGTMLQKQLSRRQVDIP